MTRTLPALVLALLAGAAIVRPAGAQNAVTHEFVFPADQVTLSPVQGGTRVRVRGGTAERLAGRPDLPAVPEAIDVPVGYRVVRVEVAQLETQTIAEHVSVETSLQIPLNGGPERRSLPDPAIYASANFLPESPVRFGYEGFQRDRNVAWLMVTPARWQPTSGRLERVSRLVVRLVLAPSAARPLERLRVVPEWEGARGGPSARTLA
ncbi:MAG TPA: C25 family peptidase propeptide domain-containing protein, partial [Candidatus Acidoferrales bacterium]|nr:C25 family peptidase propeptide domain-containing protein [Candidatus Acidoferrales bacterium]